MRKNVNNMHEMAIEPFHNMKTKKKRNMDAKFIFSMSNKNATKKMLKWFCISFIRWYKASLYIYYI